MALSWVVRETLADAAKRLRGTMPAGNSGEGVQAARIAVMTRAAGEAGTGVWVSSVCAGTGGCSERPVRVNPAAMTLLTRVAVVRWWRAGLPLAVRGSPSSK